MQLRAFHHAYIGEAIEIAAFVLLILGFLWWGVGLMVLGKYIQYDDYYQHYRQETEPDYHSPLHRFYGEYLWEITWIQQLNTWADKRMK